MSWSEIIVGGIIGGGLGGVIVGGIINHLSNKKLSQFSLINESQFKTFNELWKSLADLKIKGEELWEMSNDSTLLSFINSLKDASVNLELNSLVLNKEDYDSLKKILDKFSDYRIGKHRLIDMDKGKIKTEYKTGTLSSGARYIYDERMNQVFQNGNLKKEYGDLIDDLRDKFQNKMGIK